MHLYNKRDNVNIFTYYGLETYEKLLTDFDNDTSMAADIFRDTYSSYQNYYTKKIKKGGK